MKKSGLLLPSSLPYNIPSLLAPSRPTPPCGELLQQSLLYRLSLLLACDGSPGSDLEWKNELLLWYSE